MHVSFVKKPDKEICDQSSNPQHSGPCTFVLNPFEKWMKKVNISLISKLVLGRYQVLYCLAQVKHPKLWCYFISLMPQIFVISTTLEIPVFS